MRDHDHEAQKDGTQGTPPLKAKTGGEHDPARRQADGHPSAHPDILGDARIAHPANAEPLAELLSQLQHSHGNAYVQRVVSEAGGEKSQEQTPAAESHGPSVAQGLDAGTRSLMESAFGESFGDVRVHTGGEAERMNEELGARAVTRGRDLYFDRGEYDPSTAEGRRLLAHELAHVVQQSGEASRAAGSVNRPGDSHEQEADRAAREVLSGGRATILERSAAPAYQREPRGGGQQKAPPGALDLTRQPSGSLAGGASYTYDASAQRLTITGPQNLSVQPPTSGGNIVTDSARGTMAPGRTRTVVISVSGVQLNVTVNGQAYIFIRQKGAA
ncbi:MAG TPA: DUF4157 domain-containing protein [Pyrinomonadaceae bacterium]|jgi:hypothetical protein